MNKEELIDYLKNRDFFVLKNNIVLSIDMIENNNVFYREWCAGSDGTAAGDWAAFIGAFRMHYDEFKDYVDRLEVKK